MTGKRLLVIAGLVVAALAIGLIVSLRSAGKPPPAGPEVAVAPPMPASPPSPAVDDAAAASGAPPPATPVTPEAAPPAAQPAADPDDDGEPAVRDHRGMAPSGTPSPLRAVTVASVRQAVALSVQACAADAKIENPPLRFVVHATVRVIGGRVAARDVGVTSAEALGPDFVACVTRVYETSAGDAPGGQPDGEDLVHMPWTTP